ncbi:hypothetical protein EG68_09796 [Paragonimus skrjabini miyazakii]|uniref:Uncharacterized protein n=1 Tax=Paragonimus skrjabini miyazakii TaxID=59628 RepID=A0A8S9YHN9_9TREM|nr:hypothetical protein EG68_09796 [Paragonimus skrjabini miyazakii]
MWPQSNDAFIRELVKLSTQTASDRYVHWFLTSPEAFIIKIWTGEGVTVWLKLKPTTTRMLPSLAAAGLMLREQQRLFHDYSEVRTTGMHVTICSQNRTTRSYQLAYWLPQLTSNMLGKWKSDTLPEIDRKMLDSKFQSAMADYFRGISAPNAGALLRRMLERLMTRAVAAQITYSGAHQTFAFKRTQLKAFLIGQVHERTEYATTPNSMLNEYCKESGDVSQEKIRIVDLDEQNAFDLNPN